jgi:pantothenate synthetase
LNNNQLKIASNVYKYLKRKKLLLEKDLNNFNLFKFKKDLANLGVSKIDYLELYNLKKLQKPKNKKENFNLFVAYYIEKVRLIDNF